MVLLIVAAFLAIALAVSRLSLGEIKLVRDIPKSLVAYCAAETGIEEALYQIRILGSGSSINGCLEPEICYTATIVVSGDNITITSRGSYKDIVRSIEVNY